MKRFVAALVLLLAMALPAAAQTAPSLCADNQLCGSSLQATGLAPQAGASGADAAPLQQTGQNIQGQGGQTSQLSASEVSKQWAAADQDSASLPSLWGWLSVGIIVVGLLLFMAALDGMLFNFAHTKLLFKRHHLRS
jgi:hypothetical protein